MSDFRLWSYSFADAVGHPEQPLPDVRRADARSRQIGSPDGISHSLQVSAYSSEPCTSVSARNLLAKDDWRTALGDETSKSGPQVPLVENTASAACAAERLAGAGAGPDGAVCGPAGEIEGVVPSADAGEQVDSGRFAERFRVERADVGFVDDAIGKLSGFDEGAQPLDREGFDLVVNGEGHPWIVGNGVCFDDSALLA